MENENPFQVLFRKLTDIEDLVLELKHSNGTDDVNVNEDFTRLSRKEICDVYNISLGTLHKMMKSGDLPFEKIGRKTLFKLHEVEQYFQSKNIHHG
ncbi:helix-turn-helix domain-containing protein [Ekhidna sp.]